MPLMNTPFRPGHCMEAIEGMKAGPTRDIALAEYHYFSGQGEKALEETQVYLTAKDAGVRLSACWIFAYSCLTMGRIDHARRALHEIRSTLTAGGGAAAPGRAIEAFVAFAAAVLLHLPLPEEMPPTDEFLPLLPPGVRAFALYVEAHYLYLKQEYAISAGIVEAALAMGAAGYPISAIYLHLVAVMDYMSLKKTERAQAHLLAAWDIARPDDLTTTEFAIAMLAARGCTTQEIAEHLNISANTVKTHIAEAMRKLDIKTRKDLKQYMLR